MSVLEQWARFLTDRMPRSIPHEIVRLMSDYYPWYERCRDTPPFLLRGSHQAWLESYIPCVPSAVIGIIESYRPFEHDCTYVCGICGSDIILRILAFARSYYISHMLEGTGQLRYST
jgi:hypothetical protein